MTSGMGSRGGAQGVDRRHRHDREGLDLDVERITSVPSTYRLDWASLLKRVFSVDVLKCSRCQGKMRLIACIEEPNVAKKILEHLGLRAEDLPTLRAQAPPVTLELFPAA
jgi:hypothetical protein